MFHVGTIRTEVMPEEAEAKVRRALALMREGWVPLRGTKTWERLGLVELRHAQRVCRALGWGAAEWTAHARSLLAPWPWEKRQVRVQVADLSPHDGAGYLLQMDLFPAVPLQFRGVGRGSFAKGVLLSRQLASLTGLSRVVEEARRAGVHVVLSPDNFKGERKPRVGDLLVMDLKARALFASEQNASWQTVLMLWAAAAEGEREELLAHLIASTRTFVWEKLGALSTALRDDDLTPLFAALGAGDWPLKAALEVFGFTRETQRIALQHMTREVADGIRSAGLSGRRLLLVLSQRGAYGDRERGTVVAVRTPVRRPQGIATLVMTQEARKALQCGVLLVHPETAGAMDGDDDGDFVALFSGPDWFVQAARNLGRLDPLFQSAVKQEKRRRSFGISLRDFWNAAWLAQARIGPTLWPSSAASWRRSLSGLLGGRRPCRGRWTS